MSIIQKNSKKITVLVTGVGGRSVGYQILECLQPLRDSYRIVVTDMDPFASGLYEADAAYLLPGANESSYISKLLAVAKKEKVKIILLGTEAEVKIVAKQQKKFTDEGIIPVVSDSSVIERSFDKLKLSEFLTKKNIITPRTVLLESPEKAAFLSFPIVIKQAKDSSGSRNVFIVKDMDELHMLYRDLQRDHIEMIAQEYVGDEDDEYTVGIIISPESDIIDSIVMRRRLIGLSRGIERVIDGKKFVLSTGYSQGFFVDQPDVKDYCEYVAKVVGAKGPLNIQCRRGEKGVYIFEVHPRFSGSASMRAEMGFNEPDVVIRSFLKRERIVEVPHKLGYAVIRKFANTVVAIEEYEKLKNIK